MKPLCVDLFCGLGGWTEGFLSEGYQVIGFDIEQHVYGEHRYPGELVLQDVLTLDGRQFRNAAVIVASPPCQAYSYRAMPWKRAKALPPPSNDLFDACFRIQREASGAATTAYGCSICGVYHPATKLDGCTFTPRRIPLVIENVKGAQPWVGRAKWHYGSFYLWGDVPALMPSAISLRKSKYEGPRSEKPKGTGKTSWFFGDSKGEGRLMGLKTIGHANMESDAIKQHGSGPEWFDKGICKHSSRSDSRKAASALIAKIPFELSSYIARVFKPDAQLSKMVQSAQDDHARTIA